MAYRVKFAHDTNPADQIVKSYMSYEQALRAMTKFAYDKLEAFGKLDTQAAHDVMKRLHDGMAYVEISNTGYALYRSESKNGIFAA